MRTCPFTRPTLLLWPRSAAQELGLWDTKSEAAAFDADELIRRIHEGRKRARENRDERLALTAGTQAALTVGTQTEA
jgi:hypothetical protein